MDDTLEDVIEWECPNCGADNMDYPETTFLLCRDCEEEYTWSRLLGTK